MPLEANVQRAAGPKTGKAIFELQNLNMDLIAGASAGTDMPIPGAREGDVVHRVFDMTNLADDTPNITVEDTHAKATFTFQGSVGTPADAETITLNDGGGVFTITFESTNTSAENPVNRVDADNVEIFSGDAIADIVTNVVNVINAQYNPPGSALGTLDAVAVDQGSDDWDVVVTANNPGVGGNSYAATQAASNVTVVDFAGGRDDLAFTSTTGLGTSTLMVVWYNLSDDDLANV